MKTALMTEPDLRDQIAVAPACQALRVPALFQDWGGNVFHSPAQAVVGRKA